MDASSVNSMFTFSEHENELKEDFFMKQCRACLSVGRKLFLLGEYINIYKTLTSDFHSGDTVSEKFELCWECHALLRRVARFQIQVLKANVLLKDGQSYLCGTLSSLSTIILNNTNHTIYMTESLPVKRDCESSDNDVFDTQTEEVLTKNIKTECEKESKKNNRWAKARAIENKKPKFKLVTNCDKVFNKVKLSDSEMYSFIDGVSRSDYFKSKKYKCMSCVDLFKDEKMLVEHVKMYHKKSNKYICDICKSTFLNKRHLSAHVHKHYYVYECTICGHRCKSVDRSRHFQKHRKVFQCLKCELKFCSRREFFKHYKQWHENFICEHCGISFKMRYCIKDHIRKQHSSFECKLCNKTFARYNGLWLHNKLRHAPPGQTAYCVECDKRYVDIYRYRWHLANSARHKPKKRLRIPCPDCDKVFSKNIYMKDHYNLVHLKYYKYRCEDCDKNFIRNADLVKHRRRIHEGILPPKNKICDVCGRGFTTNKILTNHMRTHTGERPFACAACPAKFAQHTALVSHVRAVHNKCEQ